MGITSIEWTSTITPDGKVRQGMTWNPVTGCSKISAGCANCYAERMAKRLAGRCGYDKEQPFKVTYHGDKLNDPLKWVKPRKVFVCSMGDMFHEDVLFPVIKAIIARMCGINSIEHTFIVLTKRPERMKEFFEWLRDEPQRGNFTIEWPLKNVWLGVTAENQEMADQRIPVLLSIPAAKRFVSIEPMVGPVDLSGEYLADKCGGRYPFPSCPSEFRTRRIDLLDWVIVGGETGPAPRLMKEPWLKGIISQCRHAGTPLFVKQISGRNHNSRHYEMPDYARVRMFPGDSW